MRDSTFIFRGIARVTIFLSLQIVVLLAFYVSGNFQQLLDSTLRFALLLCTLTCALLAFFASAGSCASVALLVTRRKPRYALAFLAYLLILAVAVALFLALHFMTTLSAGQIAPLRG